MIDFIVIFRYAGLLAAWLAMPAVAQFQPGEYSYGEGEGILKISPAQSKAPGPGAAQNFSLDTVGANFHSCTLEGEIRGGEARMPDSVDPKVPCIVRFRQVRNGIVVQADNEQACRTYCGARASFGGEFVRVPPTCSRNEIAQTRKRFKAAFDGGRYGEAMNLLAPLFKNCNGQLTPFDKGWVSNDLALTQHRLGDNAACRVMLEPWRALAAKPDAVITTDYLPSEAASYLDIAKATRYNLRLCALPAAERRGAK